MVVVVVTFAESYECGEDMISRRMSVVKGLVTEPVGKGVDAERCVMDKDKSTDTSVIKSTSPVTPRNTSNSSRHQKAHDEDNQSVVLVLHADEFIRVEICDIGSSDTFGVLLEDHPTEMSVH